MYLKKMQLYHFRNFDNTTIDFQEGVNIIVGPNNSGKSNLLCAIDMMNSINNSSESIHDFNKNDIAKNFKKYKTEPPIIKIIYYIEHSLSLDNFDDGILRVKNFIVYADEGKAVADDNGKYTINAEVELRYELDSKYLSEYKSFMNSVSSAKEFMLSFEKVIQFYSWVYYNTTSEKVIPKNEVSNIFSIDFIPADRQTESTLPQTRKYIKQKINESESEIDLKHKISDSINTDFGDVITTVKSSIETDEDAIGISNGHHIIIPNFTYDSSFEQYFEFSLQDDDWGYDIPMANNGLGYNNLIQIFGVIKFKIDQDFNILLIEEPEAHLHPAMQYKLFQYLKSLKEKALHEDGKGAIKNQIFVTTHSPNISASADLDDMICLYYQRDKHAGEFNVRAINLKTVFGKDEFKAAKEYLTKFLDVTRGDLLFTQKAILVEGLAEKLLMSAFAKKCGLDYETEYNHISVTEVGGVNLNHFLPLFLYNKNKVVCFRDCDFDYYEVDGKKTYLTDVSSYATYLATECDFLYESFKRQDNIMLKTQCNYGSTFENELFLDNFDDKDVITSLFGMVVPEKLNNFISKHKFSLEEWNSQIDMLGDKRTEKKVNKLLVIYYDKFSNATNNAEKALIEKLFFANLFLSYVESSKGDFALQLLTSKVLEDVKVPKYIREGLEWLRK
ncbi:ATP-dependent nuclease [Lactonifactor longoviformis]|uniref:ATP-dependent nuclease n=1 Tax=Lactonifactor longoviformis TaxID=341220 RepID=UPI001D020573|nr:AAA family ATPase [Lactonifactor longoviformis]MCB5713933.1 AAA family ATPase [Lactonifactor longoviformis]MCB5717956.1 AAA family ATPase [Lactonifactor longoviformis]